MPAPNTAHGRPRLRRPPSTGHAARPVVAPQARMTRRCSETRPTCRSWPAPPRASRSYSAKVLVPMKCRIGSPFAGQTRGAVGQEALPLLLADRRADVRLAGRAVIARAALRREQRHDVVARLHRGHALADRLDDSGTLVSEHGREVARRIDTRRRCRGRCGRRHTPRCGRAPHRAWGRRGPTPGRRGACRILRGQRRGSSWRREFGADPGAWQARAGQPGRTCVSGAGRAPLRTASARAIPAARARFRARWRTTCVAKNTPHRGCTPGNQPNSNENASFAPSA